VTTEDTNDEPNPADTNEDAQIYAAAIRQIYIVDHSFGEPPGWPLVYVVTTTHDSVMVDAPTAPSQKLPADLQEVIKVYSTGYCPLCRGIIR